MSNRATAIGIFLLAFAAFATLAPQPTTNPQIVTRLGLTLSIVESGDLAIDRFAHRTIDKARFDGHYYADKVPGLSFLAIPVIATTMLVVKAAGGALNLDDVDDFAWVARVATIAVNGFISAVAIAALFLTAIRLGATRTGALFAAGALAFATPFFGWSTTFFAHSVSGSLLMFGSGRHRLRIRGRRGRPVPPAVLSDGFWVGGIIGLHDCRGPDRRSGLLSRWGSHAGSGRAPRHCHLVENCRRPHAWGTAGTSPSAYLQPAGLRLAIHARLFSGRWLRGHATRLLRHHLA